MMMKWIIVVLMMAMAVATASIKSQLPPSLTAQNFKETTAKTRLSLIEFFSPYCSHCMQFEPTWKSTLKNFANDSSTYQISMHQVNCVEQGDLCNSEKILAYPSLKLYGPQGFIKDFPRTLRRNEENLIEFMKESSLEYINNDNVKIESKSQLIKTEQMIKLLAEEQSDPWLISFWPSSELSDLNNLDWKIFSSSQYYEDCMEFQRIWSIISNDLSTKKFKIGHFNCNNNKKICKELGIPNDFKPQVKFFTPNKNTAKIIPYPYEELTTKSIINFSKQSLQISSLQSIDSIQLLDQSKIRTNIQKIDSIPSQPLKNYIIYLYDEHLSTKEDFQTLPYLIPNLMSSPNTMFYKSNDSNILKLLELQHQNLIKNINKLNQKNYEFNEEKFQINTQTSLPTLISFKELSLNSQIFQSFGPMDSRDVNKLSNFIEKSTKSSFINELTPKLMKGLLKNDIDTDQQLVIFPIQNSVQLNPYIQLIHEFEEIKSNVSYNSLISQRSKKYKKAKDFKNSKNFKDMVKTLRQEIWQKEQPTTTYYFLDLGKNPELLQKKGFNVQNDEILIINKKFQYTSQLKDLVQTLSTINKYIKPTNPLNGKLINSPFSGSLQIMDNIHQFGIWGYFILLSIITALYITWRKKKSTTSSQYLPMFTEKKD